MLARFSYLSHQFKKSEFKTNSIFDKINRPHRLLLPHSYRNIGYIILGVSVFLHSANLLFPFAINYWVPDFFGHFWRAMNHYPIEGNYSIWVERNILPSILLIYALSLSRQNRLFCWLAHQPNCLLAPRAQASCRLSAMARRGYKNCYTRHQR